MRPRALKTLNVDQQTSSPDSVRANLRRRWRRSITSGRPTTFASVALVLLVLVGLLFLPAYADPYLIDLVVVICIYGTVNIAWNLVLGYGGIFSFGQMGFFAVGGYTSALMNLHFHLSPWLTTATGAIVAALAGIVIGLPSLRLHGPYVVLLTLAFQEAIYALLVTDTSGFFGGSFGLQNLDAYGLPGVSTANAPYYVAVAMLAMSAGVVVWLVRSPIGKAVRALRDNQVAAMARGISLVQHRLIIFAVSAALTGTAGAFYAHYYSLITPATLDIGLLVNLLVMIIIGGLGSTFGVIIGTALLVYVNDRLATQAQYSAIIFGTVIILVVLLIPGGVAGSTRSLALRLSRISLSGAASLAVRTVRGVIKAR